MTAPAPRAPEPNISTIGDTWEGFRVRNQLLHENLEFASVDELVAHLQGRMRDQGYRALSYDDIEVCGADGWHHVVRGDFALLHALMGMPIGLG